MSDYETYSFRTTEPSKVELLKGYGSDKYQITDRYLLKDGKPWLPASGEIHYSRVPRDVWEVELDKVKAAGISIISTYVFWIHHEEIKGEFRWDGNLNLGEFIDLCHERGLEVALRIGPWSHGECRNGGFPDWLLQECGKNVRCNAEPYMSYVKEYYTRLVKHLNKRKLFSIQIENELVFDNEHLEALYDLAKECGFEADFFTATAWGLNMHPLYQKMLPTFGGYPEQPWNSSDEKSWPNPHFFFTGIRSDGDIGNDLLPKRDVVQDESVPYLTCELGPGVQPYEHRRPRISAEDALSIAVDTLGDGCNLLGFYMFHGGSNPIGKLSTMQESKESGYPNDCPVISYDFQAPIGEAGRLRESYYRLQTVFKFLQNFGENLAPMIPVYPDRRPVDLEDTETVRCCMRSDGKEGFLFINNHHHGIALKEHKNVVFKIHFTDRDVEVKIPVIPTDVTCFLPVGIRLSDQVGLRYALARPVSVEGKNYYFEKIKGVDPVFVFEDNTELVIQDKTEIQDIVIHVKERKMPKNETGVSLDKKQKEDFLWTVSDIPMEKGKLRLDYFGDYISVFADGRLIADQYYYGDFMEFYKAEGIREIEIKIKPLLEVKKVYLECERKNGGQLEKVTFLPA